MSGGGGGSPNWTSSRIINEVRELKSSYSCLFSEINILKSKHLLLLLDIRKRDTRIKELENKVEELKGNV